MRSLAFILLLLLHGEALAAFPDVNAGHPYVEAIEYVQSEGIVNGYPDGTYKPNRSINRAEFTKIVVGAALGYDPQKDPSGYDIYAPVGLSFSDVISGEWYIPYVRRAVQEGVIQGYPDGTFKPAQTINFVEAAKIIIISFGIETEPADVWYEPFVEALGERNAIPTSIERLDAYVTRGEMAEIIWRVRAGIVDRPSQTADDIIIGDCLEFEEEQIPNVDMDEVRRVWLGWYNEERAKELLDPYTYNDQLHRTASIWSQYSAEQGNMSHKRPGQTAYYDYAIITDWFSDLGLEFENVNRVTYSENIGAGTYSCSKADCTQDMINAIRNTFNFYLSEKDKEYQPHYTSVMNRYFNEMGMGIAVKDGTYYITTHYATLITSDPLPLCL